MSEAILQPSAAEHDALREERDLALSRLAQIERRCQEGYLLDLNDYAYRPTPRAWSAGSAPERLRARLQARHDDFTSLWQRICSFDAQFRAIPVLAAHADGPRQPFWENWWFPGPDACLLYTLLATHRPETYLEVGSGHSTRFARRAITDLGLATRIVSIDPHPTADVDAICDVVVRERCETAPAALFEALRPGDMLFIDSSHRAFQNSDVTVVFGEILPALAPGVIYGFHDIFLPWDYPGQWTERFYNEQYLLMAYLAGGGGGDEVLAPAHYLMREPDWADLRNRLFVGTRHIDWLASGFWMTRG